ncbi:unnamed protein product [Darwinula stevensoni]|uniref:Uncharacterized protein n=1 Tax=Darwinula stevensoni TaxID=69355 RepID=A0A7R9A1H0_9CRUS|nr:unnamed protein product [Darwinula stevensoni]CAG0883483.1 unnamed protein product [Darwinula stevensoni]
MAESAELKGETTCLEWKKKDSDTREKKTAGKAKATPWEQEEDRKVRALKAFMEWKEKKDAELKRETEKRKQLQEEIEKEKPEPQQVAAYSEWKKKKDAEAHEKRMAAKARAAAREQKEEEKRAQVLKAFMAWKEKKDTELQLEIAKRRKLKEQREKEILEAQARKSECIQSYLHWKAKKDEELARMKKRDKKKAFESKVKKEEEEKEKRAIAQAAWKAWTGKHAEREKTARLRQRYFQRPDALEPASHKPRRYYEIDRSGCKRRRHERWEAQRHAERLQMALDAFDLWLEEIQLRTQILKLEQLAQPDDQSISL